MTTPKQSLPILPCWRGQYAPQDYGVKTVAEMPTKRRGTK